MQNQTNCYFNCNINIKSNGVLLSVLTHELTLLIKPFKNMTICHETHKVQQTMIMLLTLLGSCKQGHNFSSTEEPKFCLSRRRRKRRRSGRRRRASGRRPTSRSGGAPQPLSFFGGRQFRAPPLTPSPCAQASGLGAVPRRPRPPPGHPAAPHRLLAGLPRHQEEREIYQDVLAHRRQLLQEVSGASQPLCEPEQCGKQPERLRVWAFAKISFD